MKPLSRTSLILFLLLLPGACTREPELSPSEVVAVWTSTLPVQPEDPAWRQAPVHVASLIPQDMVEPRLLEPSTTQVRLQAATDGSRLAFRLEWEDPTADLLPGISRFPDACAVQLPERTGPDVPAPQMGEEDRPVEIIYWSSHWQSMVDGRADTIRELYPGATVDHYPFQAPSLDPGSPAQKELEKLYAPARAVDNRMAGPREQPVQDLVAEGPGTLTPAREQVSEGRGERTETGWAVVLHRPPPRDLTPGARSQLAVAIWQGSHQEVGARKMRSVWIPLFLENRP